MTDADVILVEDNNNDVEMTLEAFHELNLNNKILVLRDGAEALKYFFNPDSNNMFESFTPPKLVLLDLKLPKVNGLEVLKLLKSNEITQFIPVVIFTSSNEQRDRTESYKLGVNSYIVKPLDADTFSRSVKEIASYWVLMNKSPYNGN